jgi:hypothetical protein
VFLRNKEGEGGKVEVNLSALLNEGRLSEGLLNYMTDRSHNFDTTGMIFWKGKRREESFSMKLPASPPHPQPLHITQGTDLHY